MRVVLLDITCPRPYDTKTLATEALGGSEASVIRWSEGLASRGHDVIVAQHNRTEAGEGQAKYVPFEALDGIVTRPDVVIAYRTPTLVPYIRERWGRDPKTFVLCSDFCQAELVQAYPVLEDQNVRIVGVSRTHKMLLADALLRQVSTIRGVTFDYLYNPLPDECDIEAGNYDPHKLVYFSSPHKGLKRTLEVFRHLRRKDLAFRLYIANPGYYPDLETKDEGVTNLGPLPHHKIIDEVRSALCVLHLNDEFPETFGMVHAEANAVGTPVLTATHGANSEVLGDRCQLIDPRDTDGVIARVLAWRDGQRPVVKANPAFRLSAVLDKMEAMFK